MRPIKTDLSKTDLNRTVSRPRAGGERARRLAPWRRVALLVALCCAWSLALAPTLAAATLRADRPGGRVGVVFGPPTQERLLWQAQARKVALMQAHLARFPYQAYVAARTRPQAVAPAPPAPAALTRLDRAGHLARPVPAADVAAWREELAAGPAPQRGALLHLWLGEWALADQKQPDHAAGSSGRHCD